MALMAGPAAAGGGGRRGSRGKMGEEDKRGHDREATAAVSIPYARYDYQTASEGSRTRLTNA